MRADDLARHRGDRCRAQGGRECVHEVLGRIVGGPYDGADLLDLLVASFGLLRAVLPQLVEVVLFLRGQDLALGVVDIAADAEALVQATAVLGQLVLELHVQLRVAVRHAADAAIAARAELGARDADPTASVLAVTPVALRVRAWGGLGRGDELVVDIVDGVRARAARVDEQAELFSGRDRLVGHRSEVRPEVRAWAAAHAGLARHADLGDLASGQQGGHLLVHGRHRA